MRRHPEAIWRSAPGFVAIARPGREILTVTGPAAGLWGLLERGTTVAEAADILAERHGAPVDVVLADLDPLWERLLSEGLLDG